MRKKLYVSKRLKRPRKHSLKRYFNHNPLLDNDFILPNLLAHILLQAPNSIDYLCAGKMCVPVNLCAPVNYLTVSTYFSAHV